MDFTIQKKFSGSHASTSMLKIRKIAIWRVSYELSTAYLPARSGGRDPGIEKEVV